MIALFALFALAPAAAPPPADPDPDPEIVVLGRLRALEANVGQGADGDWYCSLSGTTGRDWLDDRFCRAVTQCVRKDLKRGAADNDAVDTCIRSSRKKLIARVEQEMKKGS